MKEGKYISRGISKSFFSGLITEEFFLGVDCIIYIRVSEEIPGGIYEVVLGDICEGITRAIQNFILSEICAGISK